jgi:hypothetical protein
VNNLFVMTLSEETKNTFGIRTQHKTAALPIAIKGEGALGRKRQSISMQSPPGG